MATSNVSEVLASVGKLAIETVEQKEVESDDEVVRAFLECERYGVVELPTVEQLGEIKAFEDDKPFQFTRSGSRKAGTKAKRKAKTHMPNVEMVCEGMCMEITCNKKQTTDSFIEWIYLKNSASADNDGEVVACRKFDGSGKKACAIFKVGDDWKHLTPYSISSMGSWFKGDSITLDDDDGEWADLDNWSSEEVDSYFTAKESETIQAPNKFRASRRTSDGQLKVECCVPVTHMWIRSEGHIVFAKQFEDGRDGEEPEEAAVEGVFKSNAKTVSVFAYGVLESGEWGTMAGEVTIGFHN